MTPLHVDRLAASNGIEWPRMPRQRVRWAWALWLVLAGAAIAALISV